LIGVKEPEEVLQNLREVLAEDMLQGGDGEGRESNLMMAEGVLQ